MHQEIRNRLESLAEEDYRAFHQKLCPGLQNILGVRIVHLRALAREITKSDWHAFLAGARYDTYEETTLAGLVIGCAKMEIGDRLAYAAGFVPHINNWATCDVFCSSLKAAKKHRNRVWGFLMPYLASGREYELRFAVVMLMDYYVDEAHLPRLLELFDGIRHDGYYVKMAVAWAVSLCFVRFPRETMRYLETCKLDGDTFRKALQKIVESRRVSDEDKDKIRAMRKQ